MVKESIIIFLCDAEFSPNKWSRVGIKYIGRSQAGWEVKAKRVIKVVNKPAATGILIEFIVEDVIWWYKQVAFMLACIEGLLWFRQELHCRCGSCRQDCQDQILH